MMKFFTNIIQDMKPNDSLTWVGSATTRAPHVLLDDTDRRILEQL